MENRPRNIVIGQPVKESKRLSAKTMRLNMTPAEQALWQRLRNNQLMGFHFRRQQIISGFIADFYCHRAALVVEVDGNGHQPDADEERDEIIAAHGISVLRFSNEDVLERMENVLSKIVQFLQVDLSPDPSTPVSIRGKGEPEPSDTPYLSLPSPPRRGAGGEVP